MSLSAQALLLIFPACLLAGAISDIRSLKIPNWIPGVLVLAFPATAWLAGAPLSFIGQSLLIGAVMLGVGFVLFALRIVGGGDAKLIAASGIWVGAGALPPFLIILGLAGGALSLAVLGLRYAPVTPAIARSEWLVRLRQKGAGVPYGAAIAIAGAVVLPMTELFHFAAG